MSQMLLDLNQWKKMDLMFSLYSIYINNIQSLHSFLQYMHMSSDGEMRLC